MRKAIEACERLEGENVDLSRVTASVGVATFPTHAADAESLFRAGRRGHVLGQALGEEQSVGGPGPGVGRRRVARELDSRLRIRLRRRCAALASR